MARDQWQVVGDGHGGDLKVSLVTGKTLPFNIRLDPAEDAVESFSTKSGASPRPTR
jgi:hypothetical protein